LVPLGLVKIEITKLFLFQERREPKEISLKLVKIIHARVVEIVEQVYRNQSYE
jgi:hypothetical protein